MTLVPFSPPPGINSDDTTFAAEGRWADGNNVRFRGSKPQVIGGWTSAAVDTYTTARATRSWFNASNQQIIAVASTNAPKLQVNVDGTNYNISPASITISAFASMSLYGSHLIVAGDTAGIVEWDGNPANVAVAVSGAPARANVILVTPQRQLLAFGTNEETSGTYNRLCIRGSDIEDITDWTSTASNNAFEHVLENAGSTIRDARMVGEYVAVWTDSALFLGTFVGDPAQTYRFDRVAGNCGLYQQDALVVMGPTAVWCSPTSDFWAWTLGGEPQQLPCPILKDFQTYRRFGGGVNRVMGWHNSAFNEVWFFYADTRDADLLTTRYIAYSIDEQVWFRGQMGRLAAGRTFIQSANLQRSYTIDLNGLIQAHEYGNTANGASRDWHIQSADQYIDNSQRRMMIRGMRPDFEDQVGDVSLTLYTKQYPQSTAVTKGPYTLATTTLKKDFRASGKTIAAKFSGGSASGSYMRLGKPVFDVVPMGER